jgi:hypothetical protein
MTRTDFGATARELRALHDDVRHKAEQLRARANRPAGIGTTEIPAEVYEALADQVSRLAEHFERAAESAGTDRLVVPN